MVENSENRRKTGDGKAFAGPSPREEDIVELSEITVGISAEDEAILNLTEEIVGGAFEGYSRMTGEIRDEEELLDLSATNEAEPDPSLPGGDKSMESLPGGLMDIDIAHGDAVDAIEKDIARELDNYFQIEEETKDLLNRIIPRKIVEPPPEAEMEDPLAITHDRFEAALEEVVRKLFGEKIDRILTEVIERTVSDEIEELKEIFGKRMKRPG